MIFLVLLEIKMLDPNSSDLSYLWPAPCASSIPRPRGTRRHWRGWGTSCTWVELMTFWERFCFQKWKFTVCYLLSSTAPFLLVLRILPLGIEDSVLLPNFTDSGRVNKNSTLRGVMTWTLPSRVHCKFHWIQQDSNLKKIRMDAALISAISALLEKLGAIEKCVFILIW